MNAAPFCNALRPVAAAAYEHELLAAPKKVASPIVRRLVFPKASLICSLETKTWSIPERVKPRTSAQSKFHPIAAA